RVRPFNAQPHTALVDPVRLFRTRSSRSIAAAPPRLITDAPHPRISSNQRCREGRNCCTQKYNAAALRVLSAAAVAVAYACVYMALCAFLCCAHTHALSQGFGVGDQPQLAMTMRRSSTFTTPSPAG